MRIFFLACIILVAIGGTVLTRRVILRPSASTVTPTSQVTITDSYRLLLVGDTGSGTQSQIQVATAMATSCTTTSCDGAYLLGDIIYDHGVKSIEDPQFTTKFQDPYRALSIPFYIMYGNHDTDGCTRCYLDYTSHSANQLLTHVSLGDDDQSAAKWRMPSSYYVKTYGDLLTIIAIDTEHLDKTQLDWIERSLQQSDTPYRILLGHRPLITYSREHHGDTWTGSRELAKLICKQKEESKVDAYIAGHSHAFEHISDTLCPDRAREPAQLVSGGGGANLYEVRQDSTDIFSASTHGFTSLIATKQTTTDTRMCSVSFTVTDVDLHPLHTVTLPDKCRD